MPEKKFNANRYVKNEGGYITVEMPAPLHYYNKCMGGMDLFDQCLANYRCTIRSKKWWWTLFQWGVDAARTNAWLMSQKSVKGSQFPFIRVIAKTLIKGNTIPRPCASNKGKKIASNDIRYDGLHHWPEELQSRHHRCKQCGSRTNMSCSKCEIPLHPNVSKYTI